MRAGDTSPLHKLLEILLTFVLKDDILYIVVNEVQQQLHISFLVEHCGELSEWLKEHAWKACIRGNLYREFESLTLRHFYILFQVGPQRLGLAQWGLVNHVRSGRKQR